MKYTVSIKEVVEVEREKYPSTNTIYEQTVEELDIEDVIAVVNGLDRKA